MIKILKTSLKQKPLRSAFLALVLLVNSSCHPPVNIKDEVFTTSLGINGGQDVDMLTEKATRVDYQTILDRWNNLDKIQVMTPIATIEDLENEIAQLCTDYAGGCTQTQNEILTQSINKLRMLRNAANISNSDLE